MTFTTLGYILKDKTMKCTHKRNYEGIPLGFAVRGSIADLWTYRVRPGNGYYNSIAGEVYQDCYTYFVPASITNAEGEPARVAFAAAIVLWQALSQSEKRALDIRANKARLRMSGYNLFIREYVRVHA